MISRTSTNFQSLLIEDRTVIRFTAVKKKKQNKTRSNKIKLNIKSRGGGSYSLGRKKLMKRVNAYTPLKTVFPQHTEMRVN